MNNEKNAAEHVDVGRCLLAMLLVAGLAITLAWATGTRLSLPSLRPWRTYAEEPSQRHERSAPAASRSPRISISRLMIWEDGQATLGYQVGQNLYLHVPPPPRGE